MKVSQERAILSYLKRGKSLTPLEAFNRFGCFRLSARIYDMRQAGYTINKLTKKVGKKHVAEYRLVA